MCLRIGWNDQDFLVIKVSYSLSYICFSTWKLFYVYFTIRLETFRNFPSINMFYHTITQIYDRFLCFGVVAFSDYLFVFSDFGFLLSVLFDRSFSISLDFSTVKSTLGVFITDVFKSVLFVISVLCESFCFTGVSFCSVIFFLSCRLITGVCITSLLFESWSINEFMILSLFLSCSLRNYICSSSWFINLSDISLVEF